MGIEEKYVEELRAIRHMATLHAQMREVNRREIAKKNDIDLAIWQTSFPPESPQYRLAEHEWQRRLTAEQIRATINAARWQVWFGIGGLFIGALLTLIGQWLIRTQ